MHPVAGKGPAAATAWARSFSWCGKIRSSPPPWRSKPSPEQRERHDDALGVPAGPASPNVARPRSARPASPSSTARSRAATACARQLRPGARPQRVEVLVLQEPVVGYGRRVEIDAVLRLVGVPRREQRADEVDHLVDVFGGVGNRARAQHRHASPSRPTIRLRTRMPPPATNVSLGAARSMILSSMSVTFETYVTRNLRIRGSGATRRRRARSGRDRYAETRRPSARRRRDRSHPARGTDRATTRPVAVSRRRSIPLPY